MTIYHVIQPGNPYLNLSLNVDEIKVPAFNLTRVEEAFVLYKERLDGVQIRIKQAVEPLLQNNPLSQDILNPLQNVYKIALTQEMIRTIFKIICFLKEENFVNQSSFRFKIRGLCSVTIFNPHSEDVFAIHMKKKTIRTLLGEGGNSKVCTALVFEGDKFDLCADKTIDKNIFASIKKSDLPVADRHLFCDDPRASHFYNAFVPGPLGPEMIVKLSQLLDLYEMSLCDFLDLDNDQHLLMPEKILEIANVIAYAVKNLHDKKIIHRDIKPDNFLVKFNTSKETFDWNDFQIVATDYETFIKEENIPPCWVGTIKYHPPTKDREVQAMPADIYALGVFFELIFKRFMPNEKLQALIGSMKDLDSRERLTIDEVVSFLEEHFKS